MSKLLYRTFLLLLILFSGTLLYQKHTYAYHTLIQIDPIPQTKALMVAEKYVDAYRYLSYFMQYDYMKKNPEAQNLLKEIEETRASLSYKSSKFVEGFTTGMSDEFIGQASAIGSDFFLIGDLRDLALEGTHYYNDEEVDRVLVSLSTIGLVASASTFFTLGSSAVAKSGVSILKLAHRSDHLPTWLGKYLNTQAKQIAKSKNIEGMKPLFNHLNEIHHHTDLRDTLKLLSQTNDLKELQKTAKIAKRYGQDTSILLQLTNKAVLTESKKLNTLNTRTIKLASTYGPSGLVHLIKGGEKTFIKTTKRMKAYAKVGYKGEVWKILLSLMKYLSDTVLLIIMGIATLMLLPLRKMTRLTIKPHHSMRS